MVVVHRNTMEKLVVFELACRTAREGQQHVHAMQQKARVWHRRWHLTPLTCHTQRQETISVLP